MKERPILFSAPMVRAVLDGRKTQTRRVVKPQPAATREEAIRTYGKGGTFTLEAGFFGVRCRYGQPGDRLWVRETWRTEELEGEEEGEVPAGTDGVRFQADNAFVSIENTSEASDRWAEAHRPDGGKTTKRPWTPSIHMPRWASRITLEVTGIRVERLQDISEEDAKAEGAEFHDGRGVGHSGWRHDCHHGFVYATVREGFAALWDSTCGGHSWAANPWVWAITFSRRTEDKP